MTEIFRESGLGEPSVIDRFELMPDIVRRPRDSRLLVSPNDLLPISFLTRGAEAARAVGRIIRPDDGGEPDAFGTGFMISKDLLLTNWHVLRSEAGARGMAVQFGYEQEDDGAGPAEGRLYALAPDTFFTADRDLDYAVVAVEPLDEEHAGDAEGVISLTQDWGQARIGSWVNIIQHADGQPKSVVVRENQVVGRPGDLLLYTADTIEGSSGSPVFSDRWELVALHRRGVDATGAGIMANTGVRASVVARSLRDTAERAALDHAELLRAALGMPEPPPEPVLTEIPVEDPTARITALHEWLDRLCVLVRQQDPRRHWEQWGEIEDPEAIYAAMNDYGEEGASYGNGRLLDLYADYPEDENRGSWAHNLFHACGGKHS